MNFNEIVREFQQRGIGDEDQIAEHVAFLLLIYQYSLQNGIDLRRKIGVSPEEFRQFLRGLSEQMGFYREDVFPQPMPDDYSWIDAIYRVLSWLAELVEQPGFDFGQFFQQEVRYHLLRGSRGERYPTPHHIATFMAQLILPNDTIPAEHNKRLFDPTAGTGGLLVAAHQQQPHLQLSGCDYNIRWARLCYANLRLNGVSDPQIYNEAAQRFQGVEFERFYERPHNQFDYILMNPPFDSGVISNLVALAIQSLSYNGKAALVVPSGVVQRFDERARPLQYGLQAVITLPPDAFRPYNGIRSHILLVDKEQQETPIWLCALQADGYGTGMARPLDQPTYPGASELPRTLALIQQQRQATWPFLLSIGDGKQIELAQLQPTGAAAHHPGGLAVHLAGTNAEPISWLAYHLATAALIGWEQPQLLRCEQVIYATYGEEAPVSLQRSQTARVQWADYLPAGASAPIAAEWKAEETGISVVWATDILTLKQSGKGSFDDLAFSTISTATSGACLLDENGVPVSAWRHADLLEKVEKAVSSIGQALYDAAGGIVGWLLPVTAGEANVLTLLLVKQTEVSLFAPTDHAGRYGLLWQAATETQPDRGGIWLLAEGKLIANSGPRLNSTLRTPEGKAWGIAFGPQAENVSEVVLFGLCLARTTLDQQPLEPERYLPEQRKPTVRQHPAEILAKIRQQQWSMDQRIDTLLAALGPSAAPAYVDAMPLPLGLPFNDAQQTLWQRLTQQPENYFSLAQIEALGYEGDLFSAVEVRQQIDLLVSLGLLLPVTVGKQNLYRCVRQSDLLEEEKS